MAALIPESPSPAAVVADDKKESIFTPGVPEGRRVTSTVITNPKEWYEMGILIPHEALRRALLDLQDVLKPENFNVEKNPWKIRVFFEWFNMFMYPYIHSHHDNEEKIYVPWINSKVACPPRITADHKSLIAMLEDIRAMEKAPEFKDFTNSAALLSKAEELRNIVDKMVVEMLDHLAEEERFFPVATKEHFTQEEENAVVLKILEEEKVHMPILLPAIMYALKEWAPESEIARLKSVIPWIVLQIHDNVWKPSYDSKISARIKALRGDVEFIEPGFCTIL